jgi:methyl-accepting chemotaxis protein
VVADEVRNLAEISERSARDIRGVVEEIRNGVQEIMRTQRLAIGIIKEDFKQIISEVLEEKRQSIIGNLKKPDSP